MTGPATEPVMIRGLSLQQKAVHLSGTPDAVIGVVQMYRHPVDKSQFRVHTMRPEETEVGHLQRLLRAEIVSSSLEPRYFTTSQASLSRLPVEGVDGSAVLRLRLSPQTPPGRYQMHLRMDGEVVSAEVDVLPRRQLRFLSPYLAVGGAAGETVSCRLLVENTGNIGEEISLVGRLVLQEDQQICLSLQEGISAVRKAETEGPGFVRFADAFVAGLAARQTGTVKVSVAGGPVLIAPGEVADLELHLRLPKDLREGRSYDSVLMYREASIPVVIAGLAGVRKEVAQTSANVATVQGEE
jgi:hypothetical protein